MKIKLSRTMIVASILTLGIASAAFAQFGMDNGGPQCRGNAGRPGPHPKAHPVMDSGTTGVYVLAGPKFTKFDSATLEQLGQLELGITADTPVTATEEDNAAMPPAPPMPGNFKIYNGNGSGTEYLLVVVGDTFYKISGDSFAVAVKTPLPAPEKPENISDAQIPNPDIDTENVAGIEEDAAATDTAAPADGDKTKMSEGKKQPMQRPGMRQGNGQGMQGNDDMGKPQGKPEMGRPMGGPRMNPPAPPILDLNGDILYILRGHQLTAINVTDGTIKASAKTGNPPAGKKSAPAKKPANK